MKYPNTRLAFAAATFAALASFSSTSFAQESRKPIVITPPAVNNGSNASRAPFPAARPFDDVKAPDGQSIDRNVPPNTRATDPEPNALPMPRVAIMQRPGASPLGDPSVLPTGRVTTSLSASLEASRLASAIRAAGVGERDQLVADVENHLSATEIPLRAIRGSTREMSGTGRSQFDALSAQAKDQERALRKSIVNARGASEAQWQSARDRLAADYETYASALAAIDVGASVTPAAR